MDSQVNIAYKPALVKSLAGRVADFALIWTILAAPFLLFPGRWSPLAAGLLLLPWLARLLAAGRLSVPTPLDGALALLFLAACAGLAIGADPAVGLPRFWSVILGLALYYALANCLRGERASRLAGDLLLAGGAGLALLTLLGSDWLNARMMGLPLYQALPPLLRDPGDGGLFNPRVMGMGLAVLLPVPLALALLGRGAWRRLLGLAVALLMAGVAVLCQSLQAVLGMGAALVVLAAWRSRWLLLAVPLGLGLVAAAVAVVGPETLAVISLSPDHPAGLGVVLRLDMWSRALAMVRDLPYTGIGLDAFPLVQSGFYTGFIIGPEPHAHNLYLQLALDLGLPGLVAFLWLVLTFGLATIWAGGRSAAAGDRALLAGTAAGVAAYLAAGLMDTPWATKPGVLLWVLLGLGMTVALRDADGGPGLRPAGVWPFLPLAGLAVVLALGLLLWPGLAARNAGSLLAHRALAAAQAGGPVDEAAMGRAAALLEQGLPARPADGQVHRTLGRLHAWLGHQPAAVEALEQSVDLDVEDPMARYGPWLPPLRRLTGQEPPPAADDLLRVYSHWNNRYPARAEGYVLVSLVLAGHKGDAAGARQALEAGLEAGAQPRDLLVYCLGQEPVPSVSRR